MAVRGVGASAVAMAILVVAVPARADRATRGRAATECHNAYGTATERMRGGQLREASRLFQTCANAHCEYALRHQCLAAHEQLDSNDIPTIIPVVTDEAGATRRDVHVAMDGEELAKETDGQALPVDPGLHEFTFYLDGRVFATEHILIAQGQRDRTIAVSMRKPAKGAAPEPSAGPAPAASGAPAPEEAPAAPPTPTPSTPEVSAAPHAALSPLAFAAGGAVAGGTVALLVATGKKNTASVLTDVSIGFSFGALVVAAWVLVADRLKHDAPPPKAAYNVDVRTSPSGAVVSLLHTF